MYRSALNITGNYSTGGSMNMKRRSKSSRRSSILKVSRPLDEIHNFSTDDRYPKNKRVSFANTVQIKDFRGDQPTLTTADDSQPRDENAEPVSSSKLKTAQEDAETVIQISTPMGKKRRRISSVTGSKFQRLSIIPKLERSFCLSEESFEVCEDSNSAAEGEKKAMKEISLPAEPLLSKDENVAHVNLKENITVNKSFCMDMTMQPSDQQHSSFSLLSPGALLNGSFCTNGTTNSTCPAPKTPSVAKDSLDFTNVATSQTDTVCSTTSGGIVNFPETSSCQRSVDGTVKLPCSHLGLSGPCNQSFSFNAPSLSDICVSPVSCLVEVRSEAEAEQGIKPKQKKSDQSCNIVENTHNNGAVNCQQIQQNETYDVSNCSIETSAQEIRQPDLEYTCGSENEYMNLTRTIQPAEVSFVQAPFDMSSGVDQNSSNWLKFNTSCNDFLVVDESMQSPYTTKPIPSVNGSVLTPLNLQKVSLLPSSVTRLRKLRTPLSCSSAADVSNLSVTRTSKSKLPSTSTTMGQMLSKIRQTANETSSETTVITTPEAVLVSHAKVVDKQATCNSISSLDSASLLSTAGEKSIIPSPSAYVKFGAFLNCDQTDVTYLYEQHSPLQKEAGKQSCLSHHLTRVKTRLLQAINSLRVRLNDSTYTISHEAITPAVTILLDASLQALCAVNILESYGEITDQSEPCAAASPSIYTTELLSTSNDTKVHWLSEMHNLLSQDVYPAVEEAMHIAQTLYYWTLKFWDKESIQITLAEECNVSFQLCTLEDLDVTTPVMKVLSVHIQSHGDQDCTSWKTPLIECLHTSDIPKVIDIIIDNDECMVMRLALGPQYYVQAIFEALKILQR